MFLMAKTSSSWNCITGWRCAIEFAPAELSADAAQSNRPEAEEWAVYVELLREHAWPDGTIPPQFDDILRDVFNASF